jgi:hypothetical protein
LAGCCKYCRAFALPSAVEFIGFGLRDGSQNEKTPISAETSRGWFKLAEYQIPAGPGYRAPETLEHPYFKAHDAIIDVETEWFGPVEMQSAFYKFSATRQWLARCTIGDCHSSKRPAPSDAQPAPYGFD